MKSAGVKKDVQGRLVAYEVVPFYSCLFDVSSRWTEFLYSFDSDVTENGSYFCGSVVVINFVSYMPLFQFHSQTLFLDVLYFEGKFLEVFSNGVFSEQGNAVCLAFDRMFLLAFFVDLEYKMFPMFHANTNAITNLKVELKFWSYMKEHF